MRPNEQPTSAIPVGLGSQFKRQLPRYAAGVVLLGAYQYSQYWFDTRLMTAIDFAMGGNRAGAVRVGQLLVIVALGALVIRVMSRVAVFNAGRIAEYELRQALLFKLQQLGPSFYRRMSVGEIMSRVSNDLMQLRLLLGFGVLNLINTLFALASALSVTLAISVPLTMASLSTIPLLILVTRGFSRQLYTRQKQNQDAIGRMSEQVQSSIAGVRVVRSFALEDAELQRFERTNQDYLEKSLKLAQIRILMMPVMQTLSAVGLLIVFWYGGHLVLTGQLTTGAFLAFYRALGRLAWPLMALGFLVGLLQRGRASYSRLKEVYDAQPDIVSGDVVPSRPLVPELEVRHLTFGYAASPVVEDVSFRLPEGGSLAIVGRTGSGKSTLAALLPRLQPTPRGAVFIGGVDVCDLPLSVVRSTIGYAQQSAFLFSTTVARNVAYSLDEPDSTESSDTVRGALGEANIRDEILSLPDGVDTVVGERGVQLSGGQRQRVALARAFVAEPRILVLDDPLSAVDSRTERAILQAIDRQRQRRGLILITHRVAAASRCDRIIVLDRGRIVEQGTHAELCGAGGLYSAFAEEQRIERELEQLGAADDVPAVVA
jgi:ATP-binding cassette subfamily B protein